jgi:dTMP kinase
LKEHSNMVLTREPGGTEGAERIRDFILDDGSAEYNGDTMLALYWASRLDHVGKLVVPNLEKGVHVISDRFDSSTFAYQLYGQEDKGLHELFTLLRSNLPVVPDLYIYLDVDPDIGQARVKNRGEENHLDRRDRDFHLRVRDGYHDFIKDQPHVVIDANQDIELVKKDFLSTINNILAN